LAEIVTAPFRAAFNAVRSLWNSTVGGFGFDVPDWVPGLGGNGFHIPKMHTGGVVPGRPGQEVLTILQAGERVLTADQQRGLTGAAGHTFNYVDNGGAGRANPVHTMAVWRAMAELAVV
jgi:hypothetical protein